MQVVSLVYSSAIMATLRPLFAQLGAIERSDGSAQISHGRTAAVAAVFGPGDVRAAKVGRTQGYASSGKRTSLAIFWLLYTADSQTGASRHQLYNNGSLVLFSTATSRLLTILTVIL